MNDGYPEVRAALDAIPPVEAKPVDITAIYRSALDRQANAAGDAVDGVLDNDPEQVRLAGEVGVEGRRGDTGVAGDLFHPGVGEAFPGENRAGGVKDQPSLSF